MLPTSPHTYLSSITSPTTSKRLSAQFCSISPITSCNCSIISIPNRLQRPICLDNSLFQSRHLHVAAQFAQPRQVAHIHKISALLAVPVATRAREEPHFAGLVHLLREVVNHRSHAPLVL